jgi:hypothetical protein
MHHTVNRNAFLAARNCGHLLLSAYGLLVATELALKDHAPRWKKGHNVPGFLDEFSDPGLTALGVNLRDALSAIRCTGLDGAEMPIRDNMYPELRYARHSNDFAGGLTDTHLQSLVQMVEDIIRQLRAKGVAI